MALAQSLYDPLKSRFKGFGVNFHFLFQAQGIRARSGWEAVESEGSFLVINGGAGACFGWSAGQGGEEGVQCLLSSDDDFAAMRDSGKDVIGVPWRDYFQEFIRGVSPEADYFHGGVTQGNAFCGAEVSYFLFVEGFFPRKYKVVFILMEDKSHNPPHIVLEVGIIEVHRPSLGGWREAAQYEGTSSVREKEPPGMMF